MARTPYKQPLKNWVVWAPLNTMVVAAVDAEAAKLEVLKRAGPSFKNKHYLARGWRVEPATPEDVEHYAVWADNWRPSQPTASTTKRPRKSVQERLV